MRWILVRKLIIFDIIMNLVTVLVLFALVQASIGFRVTPNGLICHHLGQQSHCKVLSAKTDSNNEFKEMFSRVRTTEEPDPVQAPPVVKVDAKTAINNGLKNEMIQNAKIARLFTSILDVNGSDNDAMKMEDIQRTLTELKNMSSGSSKKSLPMEVALLDLALFPGDEMLPSTGPLTDADIKQLGQIETEPNTEKPITLTEDQLRAQDQHRVEMEILTKGLAAANAFLGTKPYVENRATNVEEAEMYTKFFKDVQLPTLATVLDTKAFGVFLESVCNEVDIPEDLLNDENNEYMLIMKAEYIIRTMIEDMDLKDVNEYMSELNMVMHRLINLPSTGVYTSISTQEVENSMAFVKYERGRNKRMKKIDDFVRTSAHRTGTF